MTFYLERIREKGLRIDGARVLGWLEDDMSFLCVYIVRIKFYSKKG